MGFFNKKKETETPAPVKHTVLAPGSRVEGILKSKNKIVLSGTFKGSVETSGELKIDKTAKFSGKTVSSVLVVEGNIDGDILCDTARLFPGCHIRGILEARKLDISRGADLQGEVKEKKG